MPIVIENVEAVQAIYFAWTLEEMRLFDVVERIVELWQRGALPLGRDQAGRALHRYWSGAASRLGERERRDLYAVAFGAPGGDPAVIEPNREFEALWLRFLASAAVHQDDHACISKAALALATNLSDHGAGLAPAARRLAADVDTNLAVLLDPDIAHAVGARDMWQVVEQVSARELDGAVDTIRYRTLAESGGAVLRWLAANADFLDRPLDDVDLLQAVEQWIAGSGIEEDAVEQYALPTESPSATPTIDLPALVRDLLDAVGAPPGGNAPRGVVLFRGPGGTGKTLAAYVVAEALGIDLLRIDLGRVISKWVAETERNLDAIFARAATSNSVLLFDEADSLFGKRTELDDTHDRYANPDAAYLLQKIEAHDGMTILATNPRSDIDGLLRDERRRRSLRAVVGFPRPRR